ncbi:MAG TPA: hypothetical protein DGT23_34410 [Micromonosporaceae bacterium]|nr:hypothetical protein [Micromonosporaceae bacterium]
MRQRRALGWVLMAAAVIPAGDMLVVLSNGGAASLADAQADSRSKASAAVQLKSGVPMPSPVTGWKYS